MKTLLLIFFCIIFSHANVSQGYILGCNIDYSIMRTIAKQEGSQYRNVGYPYIISFNKIEQIEEVRDLFINSEQLDKRHFDCKNEGECVRILAEFDKKGIHNIDVGAFSLNFIYSKDHISYSDFFTLDQSYKRACSMLNNLIKQYGYSWDTIAKYHSKTPKHKEKYLMHLIAKYKNQIGDVSRE